MVKHEDKYGNKFGFLQESEEEVDEIRNILAHAVMFITTFVYGDSISILSFKVILHMIMLI